jgi:hypothetical protein
MGTTLTFIKVINDPEGDGGQPGLHLIQIKFNIQWHRIIFLISPNGLQLLFMCSGVTIDPGMVF